MGRGPGWAIERSERGRPLDTNTNPPIIMRARLGLGFGPGKMSPLRILATISLVYICVAGAFIAAAGTNPFTLLLSITDAFQVYLGLAMMVAPTWLVAAILGLFVVLPGIRRRVFANFTEILLIGIYSSLFTLTFSMVKTHLPVFFPFWADPAFTRLDTVMTPRWMVTWMDAFPLWLIRKTYFNTWVLVATYFPLLLAIVDPNIARRRVFTALWALCWIGLGNIVAAMFMSVGPIFLDTLPGGQPELYPDVFALLARPEATPLLRVKEWLWEAYINNQYLVSSGISAFPSVHVGMATVVGLYLATVFSAAARARAGQLLGRVSRVAAIVVPVAIITVYQLVTVYIGMHYAIDGYASIVLMILAWRWLSRSALAD